MAYRQPNVDAYALNGYSFLRLKQKLASPGDIFESPQGAHAFALGPDSDISQVNVAYLDEQEPQTFLSQLTVTPQRPWGLELTAFNQTKNYAPSKVAARLLIWPAEIYDNTFLPIDFAVGDTLIREEPVIDILQYFSPPGTLHPARSDKTYYYEILPFDARKICYVLVPYYGRRYAAITLYNKTNPTEDFNVFIQGINFRMTEGVQSPCNLLQGVVLDAFVRSIVIGSGYSQITYSTHEDTNVDPPVAGATDAYNGGLFDYLLIAVDGNAMAGDPECALRVVVSDQVGRTGI